MSLDVLENAGYGDRSIVLRLPPVIGQAMLRQDRPKSVGDNIEWRVFVGRLVLSEANFFGLFELWRFRLECGKGFIERFAGVSRFDPLLQFKELCQRFDG